MLQINDLVFRYGSREIFCGATAAVSAGQRVGLVGPNGAGKTTLLRLIAGELEPDSGTISMPSRWRSGTVAQEAPGGETSLVETVLAADTERAHLLAAVETETDGHLLGEMHTRLSDIGAHAAPARAAAILAGLGFDEAAQQQPCGALSGGMRMRVALAGVLFRQPDLLLLDEPTNHLDLEAALWLEAHLRAYPHTLIVVSHDRGLLNRVANTTVHVDHGRIDVYGGGYDTFEKVRNARLEFQAAQAAKQAAQRAHMQAFVDRFRYKASKARQAQSRLKALEKMEPVPAVLHDREIRFDFPAPEPLSPPLITLDGAMAGYGDKVVLRNLDLRIDDDDRIALLGANGNGKSTLVKLLADRLKPMAGTVRKSSKLRIGYFAQHQTDELVPARTALEEAAVWQPMATEQALRDHLGRFGFSGRHADTRIASLSGGEKSRLLLALITRDKPQILLLDEPTNHLDVDSRQALVQAIATYEGAVIVITHDPHLVETVADRLWLVTDGTCRPFDGDLDDYRRLLTEQRRREAASRREGDERSGNADAPSKRDRRRVAAEARAALAPLKRKVADAERHIAKLQDARAEIERRMADPALYAGDGAKVTELQIKLGRIGRDLDVAEHRWLVAHEELDAAEAEAAEA
ncbi:MAG: ABC-F family ATP-binding cassette domain-containing protein [Rhodospirillaceae bacterium]|nr:ABC-F family ATP-binding cassette domain-containing protein [Rhodospirillaceae bacterium]